MGRVCHPAVPQVWRRWRNQRLLHAIMARRGVFTRASTRRKSLMFPSLGHLMWRADVLTASRVGHVPAVSPRAELYGVRKSPIVAPASANRNLPGPRFPCRAVPVPLASGLAMLASPLPGHGVREALRTSTLALGESLFETSPREKRICGEGLCRSCGKCGLTVEGGGKEGWNSQNLQSGRRSTPASYCPRGTPSGSVCAARKASTTGRP